MINIQRFKTYKKIIIYKYEIFGTFRAIIKMTLIINTSTVVEHCNQRKLVMLLFPGD